MEFNEKMKEARKTAGHNQEEIAKQLEMTRQQYSLYETGKRELPISKVKTFCKACHVSPNELFEWEEG